MLKRKSDSNWSLHQAFHQFKIKTIKVDLLLWGQGARCRIWIMDPYHREEIQLIQLLIWVTKMLSSWLKTKVKFKVTHFSLAVLFHNSKMIKITEGAHWIKIKILQFCHHNRPPYSVIFQEIELWQCYTIQKDPKIRLILCLL